MLAAVMRCSMIWTRSRSPPSGMRRAISLNVSDRSVGDSVRSRRQARLEGGAGGSGLSPSWMGWEEEPAAAIATRATRRCVSREISHVSH